MITDNGKEVVLYPVQKIHDGLTRMAANELIHKRLEKGVRFVIKRRLSNQKQIEEWTVTAVGDTYLEGQRKIKERAENKDEIILAVEVARMSYHNLSIGLSTGRIKIVHYPDTSEMAEAKAEMITQKLDTGMKKAERVKEVKQHSMRAESNRSRRLRLHQPKRIHVKKHAMNDPFYGGRGKVSKAA